MWLCNNKDQGDKNRRKMTDLLCRVMPEARKHDPSYIDSAWHQTRVFEWMMAYEEVRETAELRSAEGMPTFVLDVGGEPAFCAMLLNIPDVHVVCQRTWLDAFRINEIDLIAIKLNVTPLMKEFRDRYSTAIVEPSFDALLPSGFFDVVCNISVVEHLSDELYNDWMTWSWDRLRAGGKYVLTVDWLVDQPPGYRFTIEGNRPDVSMHNRDMSEFFKDKPLSAPPWEDIKSSLGDGSEVFGCDFIVDDSGKRVTHRFCPYGAVLTK